MAKTKQDSRPAGLRITKLADRSTGRRETRFDPTTGQKYLHNPDTGGAEPWPLAGVRLEETPPYVVLSANLVDRGRAEGWVDVEGEQVVHRPGGPPNDKWRVTHTFRQYEVIVFKTVGGDVRYRVTHNPDKYAVVDREEVNADKRVYREVIDPAAEVTDEVYAAGDTRVDWFFLAELEVQDR